MIDLVTRKIIRDDRTVELEAAMKWIFFIIGGLGLLYYIFSFINTFMSINAYPNTYFTDLALMDYTRQAALNSAILGIIVILGLTSLLDEVSKHRNI